MKYHTKQACHEALKKWFKDVLKSAELQSVPSENGNFRYLVKAAPRTCTYLV
jgi:hypothetical protein